MKENTETVEIDKGMMNKEKVGFLEALKGNLVFHPIQEVVVEASPAGHPNFHLVVDSAARLLLLKLHQMVQPVIKTTKCLHRRS